MKTTQRTGIALGGTAYTLLPKKLPIKLALGSIMVYSMGVGKIKGENMAKYAATKVLEVNGEKVELGISKFKYSAVASEETNCFEGELWCSGSLFAHISNRGTGGPNNVYPVAPYTQKQVQELEAFCKKLPQVECYGTMLDNCLELVIGDMVAAILQEKENAKATSKLLKLAAKSTITRYPDMGPGEYSVWKYEYAANREKLQKAIFAKSPNASILNDLLLTDPNTNITGWLGLND